MTADAVAEVAGRPLEEVEKMLVRLVEKGTVLGFGGQYMLPIMPLLVNFHPFRGLDDDDAVKSAELYQEFFIKDGFSKFYESSAAGTPHRRAIPVDQSISAGQQVLSHEESDYYLENASMGAYALAPCPCRNRTEVLGIRECKDKFPIASCLFVGAPAMLMGTNGVGKNITREEAKQYLDESFEQGLVMMTDNTKEMTDGVICLCCGCCCSITRGLIKWDNPSAFARSDFVAKVSDDCVACGECVDRCMFDAISLEDGDEAASIDEDKCMGCGVCTVTCPSEALRLDRLEREPIYANGKELRRKVAAENEAAGQKRPLM
jgi:ferredoxin